MGGPGPPPAPPLATALVHLLELWQNFICGNETGSPARAVSLYLPARVANQNIEFAAYCPLAELAI